MAATADGLAVELATPLINQMACNVYFRSFSSCIIIFNTKFSSILTGNEQIDGSSSNTAKATTNDRNNNDATSVTKTSENYSNCCNAAPNCINSSTNVNDKMESRTFMAMKTGENGDIDSDEMENGSSSQISNSSNGSDPYVELELFFEKIKVCRADGRVFRHSNKSKVQQAVHLQTPFATLQEKHNHSRI